MDKNLLPKELPGVGELELRSVTIQNHTYQLQAPQSCPVCHRHSELKFVTGDLVDKSEKTQVVWRCEYLACRQFFICTYGKHGTLELLQVRPVKPQIENIPDTIQTLSPQFVATYKEASEASALGLKEIAGPGYRKAFEFLIKDYAKSLVDGPNSDERKAKIEKAFSGDVVNEFINDKRIQAVAKRCLWVGNDETHYLRKWEAMNVTDLVNLIKLTRDAIEIDHVSKHYLNEMPEKK